MELVKGMSIKKWLEDNVLTQKKRNCALQKPCRFIAGILSDEIRQDWGVAIR